MQILDLESALEKGKASEGSVYINAVPVVRSGKKNDFMVGRFLYREQSVEFKIWNESTFDTVVRNGVGIYDVEVTGDEFNGAVYLTVRKISPTANSSLRKTDFLDQIPQEQIRTNWTSVLEDLTTLGVSYRCWRVIEKIIRDPEIEERFMTEGAAIRHHDNKVGGLVWHTTKMLRILAAVLRNNPELVASADLLALSVFVHDIGKVFEYDQLEMGEHWYAGHRIRGIEFLTKYSDLIIETYDESFYRQVQSAIAGHHGDYGDRPTTVNAAIVHYIDTLESQVTGLIQEMQRSLDGRVLMRDWGYLRSLPLSDLGEQNQASGQSTNAKQAPDPPPLS